MVPVHVIEPMLRNPGKVIAEQVRRASILFIMFVDFDQTASSLEPHELLDFLNRYFTLFDSICARHEVTKIETVGEEYVCAVGVVPADVEEDEKHGHQEILGRLIRVASEILKVSSESNEEVILKMGIHTGPVVAGVIGNKLPRFRLFGDTINTAARMMQKGLPGELQFGTETQRELPEWVTTTHRGQIEMKGKGQVMTYLLRRDNLASSDLGRSTSASCTSLGSSVASRQSLTEHLVALTGGKPPRVGGELEPSEPGGRAARAGQTALAEEVELTQLPSRGAGASRECGRRGLAVGLLEPSTAVGDALHLTTVSSAGSQLHAAESMQALREHSLEAEEEHSQRNFEEVVRRVFVAGGDDAASRGARCWGSLGLGWEDFTKEMEEDFCRWYNKNAMCKKLDTRLENHMLAVSVLTALETGYTVLVTGAFESPEHPGQSLRLPIFVGCRLVVFVLILMWRTVVGGSDWIHTSPKEVQTRMLMTHCFIVAALFVSYDAVSVEGGMKYEDIITLYFVPVYMIATTMHPFLCIPSCAFIVLAAVLMWLTRTYFANMHFGISSMIVFVGNNFLNAFLALTSEKSLRARYKAKHAMMLTHERIEHILNTLMPLQVVEEIRENELHAPPRAHPYSLATVAQSDLCGFTKLASTRKPSEVVEFIGELFGLFDELTDRHEIYKVETVGDAYIAGQADFPLTYKNSPMSVVLFGLDMIRATHEWSRMKGESVSCRVGVHTGDCIGGIVGTEMQRYHLFGRLMTDLEVLESTAPEGKVQVSKACKEAVECQLLEEGIPKEVVIFEVRTEPRLMTSKGDTHEYDEVGGATFIARSYSQLRGQLKV